MTIQRVIALLGRRDQPTDAVEEYCRQLGTALAPMGFELELRRVPWDQRGWPASRNALKLQAQEWRGMWVLLQYTALAWSQRGFPRRVLSVLRALRSAGAHVAVVFHDVQPFGGIRIIDRIRRSEQLRVMRALQSRADRSIFTIPLANVTWLSATQEGATYIPVGANFPANAAACDHSSLHAPPTVAVYGITGGAAGDREVRDILASVRDASVQIGPLRLLVFGRNADAHERALREGLVDASVELQVEGVIDDFQVVERFSASDVLLFVRGSVSSRRGSAIAGIVSGVPVIAFRGQETAAPITDAGIVLLGEENEDEARRQSLAKALVEVLTNQELRDQLIKRNVQITQSAFSWSAIASRYAQCLAKDRNPSDV